MMAAAFDDVRLTRAPAADDARDQECDHRRVHDRANAQEDAEEDVEVARAGARVPERALIMLDRTGAEQQREHQCRCNRAPAHCCAESDGRTGSRGARLCGVPALISSARLETASLLGWPDSERT